MRAATREIESRDGEHSGHWTGQRERPSWTLGLPAYYIDRLHLETGAEGPYLTQVRLMIRRISSPHAEFEMSTPAVKRSAAGSPDSGDSSKSKQASRSVSLLTPEQLQRKRAQDRESQRQTR